MIDVRAKIVPLKIELVPSVAELPICQNTLQASAPLIRLTRWDCIPTPTRQAVTGRNVVVVGGTNAIAESILSDANCG